jgi:hypothetical protein
MSAIHVGTSGYAYAHWKGVLYPSGLALERWLSWYAAVFATVELNATFYRLPAVEQVERWRDSTPPSFIVACKGSRFLTHMTRLRDPAVGLDRFFSRVLAFQAKLGPILWQLPPFLEPGEDLGTLRSFLGAICSRRRPRGRPEPFATCDFTGPAVPITDVTAHGAWAGWLPICWNGALAPTERPSYTSTTTRTGTRWWTHSSSASCSGSPSCSLPAPMHQPYRPRRR